VVLAHYCRILLKRVAKTEKVKMFSADGLACTASKKTTLIALR
jgi:hypothetical protein